MLSVVRAYYFHGKHQPLTANKDLKELKKHLLHT